MDKLIRAFRRMVVVLMVAVGAFSLVGCGAPDQDKFSAPPNAEQEAQNTRIKKEQGKADYKPPEPDFWDNIHTQVRTGQAYLDRAAKWSGRIIALSVFHALLWLIPFVIIGVIPGFLAKNLEMPVEGALITLMGIILLCGNWVGELGQTKWVWICLMAPGIILFVVGWFVKEGWWKIALVFGPVVIMNVVVLFGVIDVVMTEMIHGSYVALAIVAAVLAGFWMEAKEKDH